MISFGSIGDVIAVSQLAWSLAQSLSSSRGSSKEYQALVKELETFNNALLQVVALWQNYSSGAELEVLYAAAKEAVEECTDLLQAFREKVIRKYGSALSKIDEETGPWEKARGVGKKILWLKEHEEVLGLRRKLHSRSEGITMLMLAAMGRSQRLEHAAQTLRVEAVRGLLDESVRLAEEQKIQLVAMDRKMDEQMETSLAVFRGVKNGITILTQVGDLVFEIRNMLLSFQKSIILSQSPAPGLGTHWRQAPVTLEDALGNLIPLPLELVNSWDMLETILVKRFERAPGHTKVLKGEYAIEDSLTGRDYEKDREWSMCFRAGQKVDMSMVFADVYASGTSCPRCRTVVTSPDNVKIQCTNVACGMWFRRIEEIIEDNIPSVLPRRRPEKGEQVSTQGSKDSVDLKDFLLLKALADKGKRRDDQPGDFQRVRLMRKRRGSLNLDELAEEVDFLDSQENPYDLTALFGHLKRRIKGIENFNIDAGISDQQVEDDDYNTDIHSDTDIEELGHEEIHATANNLVTSRPSEEHHFGPPKKRRNVSPSSPSSRSDILTDHIEYFNSPALFTPLSDDADPEDVEIVRDRSVSFAEEAPLPIWDSYEGTGSHKDDGYAAVKGPDLVRGDLEQERYRAEVRARSGGITGLERELRERLREMQE